MMPLSRLEIGPSGAERTPAKVVVERPGLYRGFATYGAAGP
ncbi:MAG TPA: hypothetical protein VFU40_12405 [Gemmatimonadales bacterium]|nr:hypothetical protein [Gemmatimonadales bacterium]